MKRATDSHHALLANSGFTLVELMSVIAIVAILLGVGIPAYQTFVQNTRAATAASSLTSALAYARSEAIRRSVDVEICGGAGPTCGTAWAQGWFVRVADAPQETANVLRSWAALGNNAVIAATPSDSARLRYAATGRREGNGTVFAIQPARCSGETVRVVSVDPSGRTTSNRAPCP